MRIAAVFIAAALAALAAGAEAQEQPERRAMQAQEAAEYRTVGRLERGGRGLCTATLVAPRHVLTAAHCLHHPRTGALVPIGNLQFAAGAGPDGARERRRVVRVAVAPGYVLSDRSPASLASDVALLELDAPSALEPETVSGAWAQWEPLTIVGFARDRAAVATIAAPCSPVSPIGPVTAIGCPSARGVSGGPVFAGTGAERRLVGVVSAVATIAPDLPVTLAVPAGPIFVRLALDLGLEGLEAAR